MRSPSEARRRITFPMVSRIHRSQSDKECGSSAPPCRKASGLLPQESQAARKFQLCAHRAPR